MRGQQYLKMENFADLLWKFADTWPQLFADVWQEVQIERFRL